MNTMIASTVRTTNRSSVMSATSRDPAVEPCQHAGKQIGAMPRLPQPVSFARIVHELDGNSERLERLVEPLRLRDRRAAIVFADDEQRRRLRARDVSDGRGAAPRVE